MASVQPFPPGTKMNLSLLIDMVLQKAYHELTLLSELLPRKSDIERKIEIIRFATNTRQQFIRLLALVKWAASAEKVDKCQIISKSLDQQNMFFIDTADALARMARETFVNARLPNFSLPTAVDVLTTGTFNRLPRCIKEKIVPPDPISQADKKRTLRRLNEIIQNRLAISKVPKQFTELLIGEGKVRLTVEDEFEATLTLMGDSQSVPWRLLNIEFLVKDFETGDGKPLIHNLQVHYIHQLVQSRMMADSEPLIDLYNCLHYFAMSLQLEILHTQAKRLISEKWGDLVKVDEYITGQKLVVSYWRSSQNLSGSQSAPSITIRSTSAESGTLLLQHNPAINENQDVFHRNTSIELSPNCVSMEKVLNLATLERSRAKLHKLLQALKIEKFFDDNAIMDEEQPSLVIKPFKDSASSELVSIRIDARNGQFHIKFDDRVKDVIKKNELLRLLVNDIKEFTIAFHNLRCQLLLARLASIVYLLPVQPCFHIPFSNNDVLNKISKTRMFLKFNKHPMYLLLVDVRVDLDEPERPLRYRFFLLSLSSADSQQIQTTQNSKTISSESDGKATRKDKHTVFYRPENLLQLNPDAFYSACDETDDYDGAEVKRKVKGELKEVTKRHKANEIHQRCEKCLLNHQQIVTMVSSCNVRIPFIRLYKELTQGGIPCQGIQYEASKTPILRILKLPDPDGNDTRCLRSLRKHLISCTIRLNHTFAQWDVEYRFSKSPFQRSGQGDIKPGDLNPVFQYERDDAGLGQYCHETLLQRILADWKGLSIMFQHALLLRDYIEDDSGELHEAISVVSFDFKILDIAYGKRRNFKVRIWWSSVEGQFELEFGSNGKSSELNPHILVAKELQRELNQHNNLPFLLNVIVKTTSPLCAVGKISTTPMLGTTMRPLVPLQNISIVTHTSTHLRLFYRNCYVIDVTFLDDKIVLRDGSFIKAEPDKQFRGINPADHLMSFLQFFSDKAVISRSKTEFESPGNQTSMDIDKSHRDSFSHIHGHHDSSSHSMSSSIRSPAFSSPTTSSTGPATSYTGQLSSLSPANIYAATSPGFIQPSPGPPQSAPMASPVSWPHSPQVSQGSPHFTKQGVAPSPAVSDQSSRAPISNHSATVILSVPSFARLVTPAEQDFVGRSTKLYASPLERYFGAICLAKHLLRVVRKDDTLHLEQYDGALVFTGSPEAGLQYTVCMNPVNYQSLHLNIVPKQGFENYWMQDELRVLNQYFELVVAPCKMNILTAFARLLGASLRILKDSIKIMRIEMQPEANQRWLIEWSFMTPPGISASIAAPGTPAVVLKSKDLFFFQLTDIKDANRRFGFSILYDPKTNLVQPTEFPQSPNAPLEPLSWAKSAREACNSFLKQMADSISDQECRLFSTLQTLVKNFVYN